MTKIFLSSTWTDLEAHRRRVLDAFDRLRLQGCAIEWLGMEAFSAANAKPAALCRQNVAQADVYVGILGVRYGSLEPGSGMSMTELEYRTAQDLGKPCLLFLIDDENARIRPADMERDDSTGRKRLTELKDEILRKHVVAFFTTPEDLEGKVITALQPYLAPPTPAPARAEPEVEYRNWALDPIPQVVEIIGRQKELNRYRQILADQNVVVIEGMAGVGKTTLGAQLAREQIERGRRVFWIRFDLTGKNTGELFVWDLAAFLAQQKNLALWQFLQQEANASKPRNRAARFGLMLSALAEGRYTLCLDDAHLVAQDPDMDAFFNEIRKRVETSPALLPMQLIVMTRAAPQHLRNVFGDPLQGFARNDAQTFLATHGIRLTDPQFEELYARVEGNPQFLRMSLPGLKAHQNDSTALNDFIQGLKEQPDVRDYLMEKVYGALPANLQRILDALSIFSAPVPRETVDEVLAGEQVTGAMRLLLDLISRHEIVEEPKTQTVTLHSLVKDYCYHNLDREMRLRLHAKAATHFAAQRDWIMAAAHYYQAREYDKAAQVLVDHAVDLMKSGRRDSMLEQLKAFSRDQVPTDTWSRVLLVKGNALERRGSYDEAIQTYQEVLQITGDSKRQADLYKDIGNSYDKKGNFAEAISNFQKQLANAISLNDTGRVAQAHLGLGFAYHHLGDYARASDEYKQTIRIGEELRDTLLVAQGYANLGLIYRERGDFDSAVTSIRASLASFRQANKQDSVAASLTRLAHIYADRGDYSDSAQCLTEAITIYQALDDPYGTCLSLNNLGELYRTQAEYAQAIIYFDQSEQIAKTMKNEHLLGTIYSGLAESHLALRNLDRALDYAMRALGLAQPVRSKEYEAIIHRILGEIQSALGQKEQARKEFETAETILDQLGNKPHQAALYRSYGIFLTSDSSTRERGCEYLRRAIVLFNAMDCRKEAEQLSKILQTVVENKP